MKNVHLLRCLHPSSLRRTGLYVSLLRISVRLDLDVFDSACSVLFASCLLASVQKVLAQRVKQHQLK